MLLADLDRELAAVVRALVADGTLPAPAAGIEPAHTWRPAPGENPASFATSLAFELAATAHRQPGDIAARLAERIGHLPWVAAAEPADGYLTITATARALGQAAARLAAAGPAAADSTILAGTVATLRPWPDLAAIASWPRAWREHSLAVTGRLAQASGASVTVPDTMRERPTPGAAAAGTLGSPVANAVAWFGLGSVRYRLARTPPGQVTHLDGLLQPGAASPDPLSAVREAQASAAATRRWAAELGLDTCDPGELAGDLLASPAERVLLGMLPWLPVRVAAGARRNRPDELPAFLEAISAAWLTVRQEAPALPFGGRAASREPATIGSRLMLADAVRVVLAAGLALTGATGAIECQPKRVPDG